MGDLIEDRVVVVGEVSDILAVYVPDEVVGVQVGEFGQAVRASQAVAGGAAALCDQCKRLAGRLGVVCGPDGHGHCDLVGRAA